MDFVDAAGKEIGRLAVLAICADPQIAGGRSDADVKSCFCFIKYVVDIKPRFVFGRIEGNSNVRPLLERDRANALAKGAGARIETDVARCIKPKPVPP